MSLPKIEKRDVPRETFSAVDKLIEDNQDKLKLYLDQLLWWNEKINLVSRNVSRETVWQHIQHSLILTQFPSFTDHSMIVDAGTGGGLPGIPLAITNPEKEFILNDIVTKKMLAVKQMIKKLGLENTTTVGGSIENLSVDKPFLLTSKHAFKINNLLKMTGDKTWKKAVLYKGNDIKGELTGVQPTLNINIYNLKISVASSFYKGKTLTFISR